MAGEVTTKWSMAGVRLPRGSISASKSACGSRESTRTRGGANPVQACNVVSLRRPKLRMLHSRNAWRVAQGGSRMRIGRLCGACATVPRNEGLLDSELRTLPPWDTNTCRTGRVWTQRDHRLSGHVLALIRITGSSETSRPSTERREVRVTRDKQGRCKHDACAIWRLPMRSSCKCQDETRRQLADASHPPSRLCSLAARSSARVSRSEAGVAACDLEEHSGG